MTSHEESKFETFKISDGSLVITNINMDDILGEGVSSLTVTSGAS